MLAGRPNCRWQASGQLLVRQSQLSVSLESEDAAKFIRMMELQWVMINIMAMVGAADYLEYLATIDTH